MEEQLLNNSQEQQKKAIILGASGAIGRVLLEELCASERWSEILIIVRRELPQWKEIKGKEKLKIIIKENLDSLQNKEEWKPYIQGYSTLFCVLGSRVQHGKETFIKVDYTYCLWGAELCQELNIPHYSLLTSQGADSKSSFLYMKTKGQLEEAVKKLNINRISIFEPGLIKNRDNDKRCIERFLTMCCCCCPMGIEANQLGIGIQLEAEKPENVNKQKICIYSNDEIIHIYKREL